MKMPVRAILTLAAVFAIVTGVTGVPSWDTDDSVNQVNCRLTNSCGK